MKEESCKIYLLVHLLPMFKTSQFKHYTTQFLKASQFNPKTSLSPCYSTNPNKGLLKLDLIFFNTRCAPYPCLNNQTLVNWRIENKLLLNGPWVDQNSHWYHGKNPEMGVETG
jgi:hypothetical protein